MTLASEKEEQYQTIMQNLVRRYVTEVSHHHHHWHRHRHRSPHDTCHHNVFNAKFLVIPGAAQV